MVRWSKILLILLVALWGLFGLLGNLMKLDVAWAMVQATTAMPGIDPANAPPRANQSAVVAALGVALIVAGKFIPTLMCGWGGLRMLAARHVNDEDWHRAKSLAVAGCALTVATLFLD
ncbi:MAG: DUF2165 family protein [Pseudomonadota bacterium]